MTPQPTETVQTVLSENPDSGNTLNQKLKNGPFQYVLNTTTALCSKFGQSYVPKLSHPRLQDAFTKIEDVSTGVVAKCDYFAENLDSQLLLASSFVKSLVFNDSNQLVGDFLRLSYSKQNEFLRIVMKWMYLVAPNQSTSLNQKKGSFWEFNETSFLESFKSDPSFDSEDFKKLVLAFYQNAIQFWKPTSKTSADDIISMSMTILAHAIAEARLQNLMGDGQKLVAETLNHVFQESIEMSQTAEGNSGQRYDGKFFYKRVRDELNLNVENALLKGVVSNYHEVGESLLDLINISNTNKFVRFLSFVRSMIVNQAQSVSKMVVLTKECAQDTKEVMVVNVKYYQNEAKMLIQPQVNFVKLRITAGKKYMQLQVENTMNTELGLKASKYVLKSYKTVSLTSEEIRDLLCSSSQSVMTLLLTNKDLLKKLVIENREKLAEKFEETKTSTTDKYNNSKTRAIEQYSSTKSQAVVKFGEAKDFTQMRYQKVREMEQVIQMIAKITSILEQLNAYKLIGAEVMKQRKNQTEEQYEKLRCQGVELYKILEASLVKHFTENKEKLLKFVDDYKLKDMVTHAYDKSMTVYTNGKGKAVEVYGQSKKFSVEKIDKIVHNENVEQVQKKVNQLLNSFYSYVETNSVQYKNVDTLKDFVLYQNSLIYLNSICN